MLLERARAIPVLRGHDWKDVLAAGQLLIGEGFKTLEITFTTPNAAHIIRKLAENQEAVVGAGTILDEGQLRAAINAGAQFAVSPGLEPTLLRAARASSVPFIPGVFTPSEVMNALGNGFKVLKLFPGELGGVSHLKSLRAPFPGVSFMPTGGVNADNLEQWVDAGAVAVGIGSSLVGDGNPEGIKTRARAVRASLEAVGWAT
jgi:2-dehydro-3-deoxyphosphogluconate aldolase / (4S)-4-hydroxy-2-oxoglutarate aldolase